LELKELVNVGGSVKVDLTKYVIIMGASFQPF
jgi:hypothetical protein